MDIPKTASVGSVGSEWSSEGSASTLGSMASEVPSTLVVNNPEVNNDKKEVNNDKKEVNNDKMEANHVEGDQAPPSPVEPAPSHSPDVFVELPLPHQHKSSFPISVDSQLEESTLAPAVFRKHLKFVKEEDKALKKLYDDIEVKLRREASDRQANIERGSKSNLLHIGDSKEGLSISKLPVAYEDLDLSKRITLEEVISSSSKAGGVNYGGKLLLCLNAALPVLSYDKDGEGGGQYVITTVVQDSDTSPKAIRLEITSGVEYAEDVFHKLRYPYFNDLEPGSLVAVKNPVFMGVLGPNKEGQDVSFCIRARHEDVDFLELPPKAVKLLGSDPKKSETDDVVALKRSNSSLSSSMEAKLAAEEWRLWGNEYSVGRLHSQALFAYNIALRFDPDNVELASTRSSAMINLGYYSGAMRDVELLSHEDPFNSGYILRKVNSLWGLEKYEEAVKYLTYLLEKLALRLKSGDSSLETELKKKSMFIQSVVMKTEKMLEQRQSPEQSGSERYFKGSSAKPFYDEPEYFRPITVMDDAAPSSSSGKKKTIVVTNQKVSAGKLLAITKAFAVTVLDDSNKLVLHNHNDELVNQALQRFSMDRPTESVFFKREIPDEMLQMEAGDVSGRPMSATKKELKELCKKHYYSGNMSSFEGLSPLDSDSPSQLPKTVGGIWTFPINIRHACVGGNAIWYTVGNLMFIRAIRDLGLEEEIVMPHVDPTKPYEVRSQILEEKGFVCYCPLCQFEKSEPEQIRGRREVLLDDLKMLHGLYSANWSKELHPSETRRLHLCLEDLTILRSAYAKLNFPLVEPLYNYGTYLMAMSKFDEAIGQLEKAFFVVDNTAAVFVLMNISLHLAYCYMAKKKNRDKGKAKKWFAAVKTYAMISYGCLEPVKTSFKHEFEFLEKKGLASLKMN